jgi:hypothetical protein
LCKAGLRAEIVLATVQEPTFLLALFALSSDQAHLVSYWPARLVP